MPSVGQELVVNFSKPTKLLCHQSLQTTQRDLQNFDRIIHVHGDEGPPSRPPSGSGAAPRCYVRCTHALDADGNEITYEPRYYDLTTTALRQLMCTLMERNSSTITAHRRAQFEFQTSSAILCTNPIRTTFWRSFPLV
jgi:hypothetical protein